MTTLQRAAALGLVLLSSPLPQAQAGAPPALSPAPSAAERTALLRGRALLTEFYAVRLDGLWRAFSPGVRGQWGASLAAFRAYRVAGVQTYGAETRVVGERTFTRAGETFYVRSAVFQKAPQIVWALVLGFTGTQVTTFAIVPAAEPEDGPVASGAYDPL
ncbi:hypothetical protein [Deinococcus arcticus]|uniref:DUF4019 domain-containing protein n=1 Tax=Deinococcus arcticus TaxID=2136176 RepID=A0A2T3W5P5_9DEIO|nr:hypothetical protein [Deinococcus arcticus]PTA67114.1 hypothetical protein C8263_14465 [Deinococcus arcticus]